MKKPDQHIIQRYLNQQCSKQEAELVLEWFATPEGQVFYEAYLENNIQQINLEADSYDSVYVNDQKILHKIYDKVEAKPSSKSRNMWSYGIAAAVSFILLSAVSAWWFAFENDVLVQTAFGEVREIRLPDGSKVLLNANSELKYNDESPREIWLKGEAFFDVVHTATDAPFKVYTNDLIVNVLGTEFNVNTRREKTDVVLSEGKVSLEIDKVVTKEPLFMEPGEKVSFSQQQKSLKKELVNAQAYTSWTQGTIVFDHTPMSEVFQHLEDTYGVDVKIDHKHELLQKQLTGEVVQNLEVTLTLLEKTFDIKLDKKGSAIYLN